MSSLQTLFTRNQDKIGQTGALTHSMPREGSSALSSDTHE